MRSEGILVFNNEENQPDTKEYVQYYRFDCLLSKCKVTELILSKNSYKHSYVYEPEIIKFSYDDKEAILRHADCVFTFTSSTTTFNCTKGNETGSLGSHIKLHYKQHSFFE
jgi:hypothetical protein